MGEFFPITQLIQLYSCYTHTIWTTLSTYLCICRFDGLRRHHNITMAIFSVIKFRLAADQTNSNANCDIWWCAQFQHESTILMWAIAHRRHRHIHKYTRNNDNFRFIYTFFFGAPTIISIFLMKIQKKTHPPYRESMVSPMWMREIGAHLICFVTSLNHECFVSILIYFMCPFFCCCCCSTHIFRWKLAIRAKF